MYYCFFFVIQPPTLNKKKDLDGNKKSCLLQLSLWLGLDEERDNLLTDPDRPGGDLITYAETVSTIMC